MISPTLKLTARLAAVGGVVALLSACGAQNNVDPTATAKYIGNVEFQQTGFTPADIRCPGGVRASAGGRFTCHFTGPEGPYTAYLRIVKVNGRRVAFQLKTQPSSWPAPALR